MFKIISTEIDFQTPWNRKYRDRLRDLDRGDYKIAYYYPRPDTSTFRYRVYNTVSTLQKYSARVSASYFTESDLDKISEILGIADVLVLCRAQYDDKVSHVIALAKNMGRTVIYDIDDLVFDTSYVHLILKTLGNDLSHPDVWGNWFGDYARYGGVLSLCDRAITTNAYLAEKIGHFTGKPVGIIPNFLNSEQLDVSSAIYRQKQVGEFLTEGPIVMGYFSGSPTHKLDFAMLTDALLDLFDKYENLRLRVVGVVELDEQLSGYSDRIEILPFQDYLNLQQRIGEVEINLVPLQDNEFTNCKSELKYFEAGIVGTVSITSPTYIYNKVIEDGQNGFLAKSYEWSDKIEYLLNNMGEYRRIAENAHDHSEQNYSCQNMAGLIEKVLLPDKLKS